jgi:hypothetical protein
MKWAAAGNRHIPKSQKYQHTVVGGLAYHVERCHSEASTLGYEVVERYFPSVVAPPDQESHQLETHQ